jgi:hypothetical protein
VQGTAHLIEVLPTSVKRKIAVSWASENLDREFEKADTNKDGQLSLEEFKAWGAKVCSEVEDDSPPSTHQLFLSFLKAVPPFLGFGFIDNFIMLIAGEAIDRHIGHMLGLSSMGSCALGNMFSGIFAIALHGTIEGMSSRICTDPELTLFQSRDTSVQYARMAGSLLGMMAGSLTGIEVLQNPI